MDTREAAFVAEYRRQREALLAEYPELAEDEQALADTLEGMTHAPDLIAQIIRGALDDEAFAEAVGNRAKDMTERKQRYANRAARRRQAALALLVAIEQRRLEQPDFTVSIRAVPPRVEVYDEESLPDMACKIERKPDKTKIKELLADGPLAGARMTNGSETISIRST